MVEEIPEEEPEITEEPRQPVESEDEEVEEAPVVEQAPEEELSFGVSADEDEAGSGRIGVLPEFGGASSRSHFGRFRRGRVPTQFGRYGPDMASRSPAAPCSSPGAIAR